MFHFENLSRQYSVMLGVQMELLVESILDHLVWGLFVVTCQQADELQLCDHSSAKVESAGYPDQLGAYWSMCKAINMWNP